MLENMEFSAREITERFWDVAENHKRRFSSNIEAVLVFSGPGTYYDKLKPGQAEHLRWMDRDRIRAGAAVVREVTASAIKELQIDVHKRGHYVTQEEISKHGPFLVYNGIPIENKVFRTAIESEHNKIPQDKIIVIDEVREAGRVHPIRHTGDQYLSFFQEITNPSSPLVTVENVALVAHIPDFIRHPFYAKLLAERLRREHSRNLNVFAFALKNRPGTEQPHLEAEIEKLIPYAKKGDLARVTQELLI